MHKKDKEKQDGNNTAKKNSMESYLGWVVACIAGLTLIFTIRAPVAWIRVAPPSEQDQLSIEYKNLNDIIEKQINHVNHYLTTVSIVVALFGIFGSIIAIGMGISLSLKERGISDEIDKIVNEAKADVMREKGELKNQFNGYIIRSMRAPLSLPSVIESAENKIKSQDWYENWVALRKLDDMLRSGGFAEGDEAALKIILENSVGESDAEFDKRYRMDVLIFVTKAALAMGTDIQKVARPLFESQIDKLYTYSIPVIIYVSIQWCIYIEVKERNYGKDITNKLKELLDGIRKSDWVDTQFGKRKTEFDAVYSEFNRILEE